MMGLGMGLSMMPLNTHVLNAAPRKLVGRVTPLTAAQQVVVSFAVAGLTGFLTSALRPTQVVRTLHLSLRVSCLVSTIHFSWPHVLHCSVVY